MRKSLNRKRRYLISCALASVAGILGIIDPVLTSLMVDRVMDYQNLSRAAPVAVSLAAVKFIRFNSRATMSRLLGGDSGAPIVWLQKRIGGWLGWLEPLLHNWGFAGMLVEKVFGKARPSVKIASALAYMATDLSVSVTAGILYYFTTSYVLSFLSVLILPLLTILPRFAKKERKTVRR